MIDRVIAADTQHFVELIRAARLSPARDFQNVLLRGVDFTDCDLGDFDFTGTTFASCRFERSYITGARFDQASFDGCDLGRAIDYPVWALANGAKFKPGFLHGVAASEPSSGVGRGDRRLAPETGQLRLTDEATQTTSTGISVRCLCEPLDMARLRRSDEERFADHLMFEIARRIEAVISLTYVATSPSLVEFTFQCDSTDHARADLERLREDLTSPIRFRNRSMQLDVRIGAAAMRADALDETILTEATASALAHAHDEPYVVFLDLSGREASANRFSVVEDLQRAIAAGELFLQYQPKVDLRHRSVSGAQAVLRWNDPRRGLVMPSDFAPYANTAGLLEKLAFWTLNEILESQRSLCDAGHDVVLSMDLPSALLGDVGFVEKFCAKVAAAPGIRIGVEMQEGALLHEYKAVLENLRVIGQHGVCIAIDGYGAGLSSLSTLKQIPAAELKIDRAFVTQMTESHRDPLIVRSTIDLAHALGMTVTAVGVETPAVLSLLSVMGCDMVQGFLISRPLSLESLHKFLDDADLLTFLRPANSARRLTQLDGRRSASVGSNDEAEGMQSGD